jgi:hypothetical protein
MSFGKTGAKFVGLWLGMSVFLACGQTKENRRMGELATQIVVRASLERLASIVDVLSEPPTNLPIQVTVARGLPAISRGGPDLLKANAKILGLEAAVAARLARNPDYVADALKNLANGRADERFQAAVQSEEARFNERVTPEVCADVVRIASELEPGITKDLTAAVNGAKSLVRQVVAGSPGILKPFLDEKSVPEQLQKSRARVQALLTQAWARRR